MRIGIAFPILVFVVAVAFLTWFVVGGYATSGS
ncbi:TPA: YoaK family small membrane protein [Citrobacter pasteurii]|nr:YoaK family small membrane protein [Citrobacter pasteurii]